MRGLADEETNWVCNLANASSLLWHMYHSLGPPSSAVNWAGFYVLDARDHDRLILGPFHGKVACQRIEIGKGVCGTAAEEGKTILLGNVRDFPHHIACDADSRSEIVVPIKVGSEVSPPPITPRK
jgi:L-methionine (R)-S-oxide reductase